MWILRYGIHINISHFAKGHISILQKTVFYRVKDGKSQSKRAPFASHIITYCLSMNYITIYGYPQSVFIKCYP